MQFVRKLAISVKWDAYLCVPEYSRLLSNINNNSRDMRYRFTVHCSLNECKENSALSNDENASLYTRERSELIFLYSTLHNLFDG